MNNDNEKMPEIVVLCKGKTKDWHYYVDMTLFVVMILVGCFLISLPFFHDPDLLAFIVLIGWGSWNVICGAYLIASWRSMYKKIEKMPFVMPGYKKYELKITRLDGLNDEACKT